LVLDGDDLGDDTTPASAADDDVSRGLALLRKLRDTVTRMPVSIPEAEAGSGDVFDRFFMSAGAVEIENADDAWEKIDPVLNRLVGYGMRAEDFAVHLRRSPFGMHGVVEWVGGQVTAWKVKGSLLEGKVGVMLRAL